MPDHGFTAPDSDNSLSQQNKYPPMGYAADPYLRIARWCGIVAILIGISGIFGWVFGIPALNSIVPGLKPIAISAAIASILLGGVQFFIARAPLRRPVNILLLGIALFITLFGLLEIISLVPGVDVSIEDAVLRHYPALFANPNAHIAPAAAILVFLLGLGQSLFLFQCVSGRQVSTLMNTVGLLGGVVVLIAGVFLLGYIYGTPLFYGSALIPIAALAALAALLLGIGLVATAGKEALPLRWFTAATTQAKLLRAFLPLTALVLLLSNALQYFLARATHINPALSAAILTMVSVMIIGVVVLQVARVMGNLIDLYGGGTAESGGGTPRSRAGLEPCAGGGAYRQLAAGCAE